MVIKQVELETVCGITSTLPENTQPEVAFAGKSNVGKSSLINCILNRKSLARTSAQPGKTQTINYYHLNDSIYLVDLPGYGYAKASKSEVEKWGVMIENYLAESEMLRVIFLLVDIRHAPGKNDIQMFDWIRYMEYQPIILATKADKIKRSQLQKHIKILREGLGADEDTIIVPFSSVTGQGREEVLDFMDQVLENEDEYNEE
ncbi:MAG: YihA family ribosome biogenesis GTP-binding protein [Lachnospiraceae bacterium]|nr:YihA family ribosome biogenesis GTP-binding protein [Lachnospiraceae bacterium]MBQ2577426.1 YihA family ribosome biogenesis GTP-binding protein [Lachnospiraceae bacterium]MBQ5484910.1 YihA family ribosome biogenesis GTP-binding protein [Lachnospiraceae bacterium]MCR4732252.1 ribosome biogenesis GTP-binding protein YihA/YsxC [Lachnospiraceae bacterium]MEE3356398.1 ribosome biogenesis GTP-binding protein YihA/YsxC [Candidatus Weimeria sp.]